MYPEFRIQFHRFLAELEVQNGFSFSIGMHFAQHIASTYQTPFLHTHRRQIAIHRNITSMAYQHIGQSIVLENSRHLTIKMARALAPAFPLISMPLLSSFTFRSPFT